LEIEAVRWIAILITGIASAGLIVVSVAMNWAFGSSFGRTALESHAYGAAFAFADVLKVAAPIVVAKSFANRRWGAALLGLLVWGTFTVCSAVSAIGFASANRTFAVDARKVQAALNQSRLTSLEADQSELRRLRDRLASIDVARSERLQLAAAVQRLEGAIGATRGKLEDAAPVVSMPNPQVHTLAQLTGFGTDNLETVLVLLVALLVEMGGLGPFITMKLVKVLSSANVPPAPQPVPQLDQTTPSKTPSIGPPVRSSPTATPPPRPTLVTTENLPDDLGSFLNLHARRDEGSTLSSTDLLARYNSSRRKSERSPVSQRRLGDTMNMLGYRKKIRLAGGRIHYQGLEWVEADAREIHEATAATSQTPPRHKNGAACA